jgi:DNA modification methylase
LAENVIKSVLGSPKMIAEMGKLLVVDCFMGSGTTAVAAKKLGCDYIGFDLSQKYIDMANERIALTENKSEKLTTIWD